MMISFVQMQKGKNAYYNQYIQAHRDLCQLCNILGGKYLEMFNELVVGEEQ